MEAPKPILETPKREENFILNQIKEYKLNNNGKEYIIQIGKTTINEKIGFKIKEIPSQQKIIYDIYLSLEELQNISRYFRVFDNINEALINIEEIFQEKNVNIKAENNNLFLILQINKIGKGKEIVEINLEKRPLSLEEINRILEKDIKNLKIEVEQLKSDNKFLKEEIDNIKKNENILKDNDNFLQKEIEILKKEIEKLKKNENQNQNKTYLKEKTDNEKFHNDPKDLIFKQDICDNAHKSRTIDKLFCAFKSFSGEVLVVWGSNNNDIEFYDCGKNKIIKTIFRAHNDLIMSCRHYPDINKRIDYIITSSSDKSVKVWDFKQNYFILNIPDAHLSSYIYSVSLLVNIQKEVNYIITSADHEKIKVWNFKGGYLRNFKEGNESIYFIEVYLNKSKKQYFVITAGEEKVQSYYFNTGNLYHKYKGSPQSFHMSVIINNANDFETLIESDGNGYIRMWNFNTAELIKTINSNWSVELRGICLWNDKYLFASGGDYQVYLFDLEEGKLIKFFKGHASKVCTIEKIVHPSYGECIISQGLEGKIKLWIHQ